MRDRPTPAAAKSPARRATFTVDAILVTPRAKQLAVLLTRNADARARERWCVPFDAPSRDESLEDAARRISRRAAEAAPAWLEQVGAFGEGRHPGDAELSVAFVGVLPQGVPSPMGGDASWFAVAELPALAPRQRTMVDGALEAIRSRLDQSPIAFRLLPPTFTLSELQGTYEILLGRRLHKASFRRALQSAWLVEP